MTLIVTLVKLKRTSVCHSYTYINHTYAITANLCNTIFNVDVEQFELRSHLETIGSTLLRH